jgi:NAD(P)-dependent dehydrogenase (short-subunit alcohol dehydrogenase family)
MLQLSGKTVLVTGGSRGIGKAIALHLAAQGAEVALTYREQRISAEGVIDEIKRAGGRATAIQADVATEGAAVAAVQKAEEELGALDAVINNAGALVTGSSRATTTGMLDHQYAVNARGSFLVAQATAESMIRRGVAGRIVFVTSRAATRALPNLVGYCMSKAAQEMLMRVLAIELAPHGITVNAVAPGTTETDLNRELLRNPENRETLLKPILLGRAVRPTEVAAAVGFLLSGEAGFITGCTIPVDGGAAIS